MGDEGKKVQGSRFTVQRLKMKMAMGKRYWAMGTTVSGSRVKDGFGFTVQRFKR
jgi:hypothetical protein